MLDEETLTLDRYQKRLGRAVRHGDWGSSDGAIAIDTHYFLETEEVVVKKLKEPKRRTPMALFDLSPELLAFGAVHGALSYIGGHADGRLSGLMFYLGKMVEDEVYAWSLKNFDTVGFERIEKAAKRKRLVSRTARGF